MITRGDAIVSLYLRPPLTGCHRPPYTCDHHSLGAIALLITIRPPTDGAVVLPHYATTTLWVPSPFLTIRPPLTGCRRLSPLQITTRGAI